MTKFPLAHRMGAYGWNYVDLKKIQKVVHVCVYEPEFVDQDECLLYFLKKKKKHSPARTSSRREERVHGLR